MNADDEKYFHDWMDSLDIPRISKAGSQLSLFGRLFILFEDYQRLKEGDEIEDSNNGVFSKMGNYAPIIGFFNWIMFFSGIISLVVLIIKTIWRF